MTSAADASLITLDPTAPDPPFEQVRLQLAAQVVDGVLAAGTRLPPVRQLAEDLGLAVNTVARAYRELESAGLVETRGRGGTIVTAAGNSARLRLQEAAHGFASLSHDLGIADSEAVAMVTAALGSAHPAGGG